VADQRRAIVENRHIEIELQSQRRDGLGNMAGAGNPESGRRCDYLAIEPAILSSSRREEALINLDFGFRISDFDFE